MQGFSRSETAFDVRFALAHSLFVRARDIWLALDEPTDRRKPGAAGWESAPEWLTLEDCEEYHRQLFYWLILRSGRWIRRIQADQVRITGTVDPIS